MAEIRATLIVMLTIFIVHMSLSKRPSAYGVALYYIQTTTKVIFRILKGDHHEQHDKL